LVPNSTTSEKSAFPDHVLHKPAALRSEGVGLHENASRHRRTHHARHRLRAVGRLSPRIVRHHHEHFDGSGYPDKLVGTDIPIFARIISLADCYDAVSEPRPYHKARQHTDIMDLLESESGTKHDPDLLHAFSAMIEKSSLRTPDLD
jgi:response regulator RpfG family c-di-GMP phosphodiesterase